MRVARLSVIAAALMAIANASIVSSSARQMFDGPQNNQCLSWVPSTSSTKTNTDGLLIAGQSYVLFSGSGSCVKQGDIIPCYSTNASVFGHHDYVAGGLLPYDFCRVAINGDFDGANNFLLPQLGADASKLQWVTVKTGDVVPAGAISVGNTILARATNNAVGNCAGQFYTGWVDGPAAGTLGRLHFVIEQQTFSVSTFDVATCNVQTPAPPTPPPTLPPNNKPYIRFGNAIATAHNVDVIISQGNVSFTWTDYAFAQFSTWVEIFSNGAGQVSVYENSYGKRGPLLMQRGIELTPGPLVVVTRGAWPPTGYNSVEEIAASYDPVAVGSGVRLFNLSPDTVQADLTDTTTGKVVATKVDYSIGSGWYPIAAGTATFTATDSGSGKSLAVSTFDAPKAPFVFTFFLLGLQNATGTYGTTSVSLIDAPEH